MRPNIERPRVVLDKIREYERLLPLVGQIAIENNDLGRLEEINGFREEVAITRDLQIPDRSFAIYTSEAERLITRLNNPSYIRECVENGVIDTELTTQQYRQYQTEVTSCLGQIYSQRAPTYMTHTPPTLIRETTPVS